MPVLRAPGHLLLPLVAIPCLAAAAGGRTAFAFPVPQRNPAAAAGTVGVHCTHRQAKTHTSGP